MRKKEYRYNHTTETRRSIRMKRTRIQRLFLVFVLLLAIMAGYLPEGTREVKAAEPTCGIEEHTHGADCSEKTLTCEDDSEGHTHDDSCYEEKMTCEKQEHTHDSTCYEEEKEEQEDANEQTGETEETEEDETTDSDEIQAATTYRDIERPLGKYTRPEVTTSRREFDAYTVETVQPSNVKVNLFDYWTETQDATDAQVTRSNAPDNTWQDQGKNGDPWRWNYTYFLNEGSINWGHALIFGPSNLNSYTPAKLSDVTQEQRTAMEANRGNWAFGKTYNSMTGNGSLVNTLTINKVQLDGEKGKYFYFPDGTKRAGGPWKGIVNQNLGSDGYPVLAVSKDDVIDAYAKAVRDGYVDYDKTGYPLNTESLQYLFNPDYAHNGKASYKNVTGLFQINEKGNYYYDSDKNFASYNSDTNSFDVYNTRGVTASGRGNFFPFNEPGSVFTIGENGLSNKSTAQNQRNPELNHYFGLTMETDFMQPRGGIVGSGGTTNTPMTFEFFGDDDIWIYIDGVLVSDLGGVHDYCYTKIDFSTGKITVRRNATTSTNGVEVSSTTLAEQFQAAGKYNASDFNGNTFRDNSIHEMKVFYLERGNYDSNLRLEFNMISPRAGQIIKVNQDGEALSGAEFALYEANVVDEDGSESWTATGTSLGSFTSGADGTVVLGGEGGAPVKFDPDKNYILREVTTPDGYVTTGDIHLTFDEKTSMLEVKNKWTTGAVASFEAQVYQAGDLLYYSDEGEGKGEEVDSKVGQAGLIVAVPFYSPVSEDPNTREGWKPIYGSVSEGFHTVNVGSKGSEFSGEEDAVRTAALEAVLRQIRDSNNEEWYLQWNSTDQRYEGVLVDLPGSVDRYMYNKENDHKNEADMNVAYYLLDLSKFGISDVQGMNAQQKYDALKAKLKESGKEVNEFAKDNSSKDNIRLLDISGFNRQFYTRLYIPNQARKFEVLKQDEKGKPLANAEFTLYSDEACTTEVAKGKTDKNGKMSFSVENTGGNGLDGNLSSEVKFALGREKTSDGKIKSRSYWLKETKAPEEYGLNDSVIEVRITRDSTYIYAGDEGEDDGVKVRKGLSVLLQTMVRYAASSEIDVTLRDVTLQKYLNSKDEKGEDITEFGSGNWDLDKNSNVNLHYGLEGKDKGFDYGIHKEDSGSANAVPYYETEYGWLGYGVKQNYHAHENDAYDEGGRKTPIWKQDISALFPDTTQVVVTDKKDVTGNIEIVKKGEAGTKGENEPLRGAEFKIEKLINNAGDGEPENWIVDESKETGYTATLTTNKDGKASAEDLPYGRYRITETKAPDGYQIVTGSIDVTIDQETFANPPKDDSNMVYDTASKTVTVIVHNDKLTRISLLKVDKEDHNILLEGAVFKLAKLKNTAEEGQTETWVVDDSFEAITGTTDSRGKINFYNLECGRYRLTEVTAPTGYQLLTAPIDVTISKDNFTAKTEIEEDEYTMDYFNVTDKEIAIEAYDTKLANIAIIKKGEAGEGTTSSLLKGAEFKLEKLIPGEDGKEAEWKVDSTFTVNNQKTDKYGYTKFKDLSYGTYRITEIKSPSGYILLKDPVHVTLNDEELKKQAEEHKDDPDYDAKLRTITVTITNEKGLTLPLTGGLGVLLYMAAGIALIIAALLLYRKRKRG